MTKEEVIRQVNESVGSLFTKQDVINLIGTIMDSETIPPNKIIVNPKRLKEHIDKVINDFDGDEFLSINNCEYKIVEFNKIEIININYNTDDFKSVLKDEISKLFESDVMDYIR
jgi:hypothetical protein